MRQHTKKIINELCNYLGYDLDGPMCQELHDHVQNNPDLQDYIESVRVTVKVCKNVYEDVPTPKDVKEELLIKLNQKRIIP